MIKFLKKLRIRFNSMVMLFLTGESCSCKENDDKQYSKKLMLHGAYF